ncbi:uncharacterized protein DUF4494 [Dysgonomonas alginatilytica]|uniref:Uncharacterized protein DUF4494 n=1 Tax=Dysgonomonas alginatilytica TaxID=1605892 RepID=A0A2V3PSX3_9BACT|nr:DUF4494 domain-containing protein [Dysgonomonas alginatilytica]PXV66909.1 uncharacterized protein DUF4494 [Dysgonomonas alginatilytica]
MHNWFICKVSYEKTLESSKVRKVTEPYLVDALSFTEAEARIIEEMKPFISGEFTIADISRYPLAETFFDGSGDRYFKATVAYIGLDEQAGSEKKTKALMLIKASDLQVAKDRLTEGMKGTLADWELPKIEETQIMDVFIYS